MSISYRARFDSTPLTMPQVLMGLQGVMGELGLLFTGSLFRLVEYEGGPTVDLSSLEPVEVQSMEEIANVAAKWWGVGLQCVSAPVAKRLGRGDWMEVYFALFRASKTQWALSYTEQRTVQQLRIEDPEAAQELYTLQLRLCAALGFNLSVYDEENDALPSTVRLKEVEQRLMQCARGELGCSLVVALQEMDLERARKWVGTRAHSVRLAPTRHILFPFLLPDGSP